MRMRRLGIPRFLSRFRDRRPNSCCYAGKSFGFDGSYLRLEYHLIKRLSFSTEERTSHAFDRDLKRMQRDNAARAHKIWREEQDSVDYDYFRQEVALRIVDRLDDIKREEGFPLTLDLGAGPGFLHRVICSDDAFDGEGGIGGVRKLVQVDSSSEMLYRDEDIPVDGGHRCDTYRLVADEEGTLLFPDGTFDLVISSNSMHWINKLPTLFKEAKRVLRPDGCFMFSMVGGTTLPELRVSLILAELEREGGVAPHVGPYIDVSQMGGLLQEAGFALPTVDVDTIKVSFPNAAVLMEHLQRMGEGNASINRREATGKDTFLAAACIYDEMFQVESEDQEHRDGSAAEIEASVQVIYAIGWSPHDSQPKPLKRGSATHKIGDPVTHHKSKP